MNQISIQDFCGRKKSMRLTLNDWNRKVWFATSCFCLFSSCDMTANTFSWCIFTAAEKSSYFFLILSRKFWSIPRVIGSTLTKTFRLDRRWLENEPYCDRKIWIFKKKKLKYFIFTLSCGCGHSLVFHFGFIIFKVFYGISLTKEELVVLKLLPKVLGRIVRK